MRPNLRNLSLAALLSATLAAQLPSGLDLQSIKQAMAGQTGAGAGLETAVPSQGAILPVAPADQGAAQAVRLSEEQRLDHEIRAMKAREKGSPRFAADLFLVRQHGTSATEGGIAEDYVLGTGDQLSLNVFGSATFNIPAQVDGRGEIVIPKVGTAKVGGLTLAGAKQAVQGLINRNFSNSKVDLQVVKLREVRVFVMGEVYKPGSYLVSSLSSLVNVLSLTGGPTAIGSYRDIRVMRGGKKVHGLDLYPLRSEGLGNPNVALQSGDTIFVPLAQNQVTLEGAFQRVVAHVQEPWQSDKTSEAETLEYNPLKNQQERIQREIQAIQAQLAPAQELANPSAAEGGSTGLLASSATPGSATPGSATPGHTPGISAPAALPLTERTDLEARLGFLQNRLRALHPLATGDHRLKIDPGTELPYPASGDGATPAWLRTWNLLGTAPLLQFELRPGETAGDALRFAGGFAPEAGPGTLTLRRRLASGVITGQDVPTSQADSVGLQRGDVLSALPQRERTGPVIQVAGWARVPGFFARTPGLRVGDLLKRDAQVLPDTYLARGEVVRSLDDGTTQYFPFDVAQALAGNPDQNLLLADRDQVELYRLDDLRSPETVKLLGPVTRPGTFAFHEGMRAADLIFRAGVPLKSANQWVAELAHSRQGEPSEIIPLDLAKLLSTDSTSPVSLQDDTANPRLRPDDQISLFQKPGFKVHRVVQILGQVQRPGTYVLEADKATLSELVKRAGALTPDAMPQAGIFLRHLGGADTDLQKAAEESGVSSLDPTTKGITSILERLSETKRQRNTGQLLKSPLLHGLAAGNLNRMVVDFTAALQGDAQADVALLDGDAVIIPRFTDTVYVVGETASPFAAYKASPGMKVSDLLKLAGGTTRNADTWNIRLLKADGRILDRWLMGKAVEPGDAVLVPQRIRQDTSWQENLQALTPLALILNAIK